MGILSYKFSFYFYSYNPFVFSNNLRNLYASIDVENVCLNIDKNYISITDYNSLLTFTNNLFQKNKPKTLSDKDKEFLSKLIVKGKLKDFINYFEKSKFNIIFSITSLTIIIIWIIVIICFLKGGCIFRKNVKFGKCANFSLLISLLLYIFVLVCSIYSFRNIKNFFFYFNGSICSLMKFFHHFKNGISIKKENEL